MPQELKEMLRLHIGECLQTPFYEAEVHVGMNNYQRKHERHVTHKSDEYYNTMMEIQSEDGAVLWGGRKRYAHRSDDLLVNNCSNKVVGI